MERLTEGSRLMDSLSLAERIDDLLPHRSLGIMIIGEQGLYPVLSAAMLDDLSHTVL